MSNIEHSYDARVCVDCFFAGIVGEIQESTESDYTQDTYDKAVAKWLADMPEDSYLIMSFETDDNGEIPYSFSWQHCDLCDSHLGGDRYDVTITTIWQKKS